MLNTNGLVLNSKFLSRYRIVLSMGIITVIPWGYVVTYVTPTATANLAARIFATAVLIAIYIASLTPGPLSLLQSEKQLRLQIRLPFFAALTMTCIGHYTLWKNQYDLANFWGHYLALVTAIYFIDSKKELLSISLLNFLLSIAVLNSPISSPYFYVGCSLLVLVVTFLITIARQGHIQDRLDQESDVLFHQQQLLETGKMRSLGEMAAGMAHEIYNPLTVIIGKSIILRKTIEKGAYDQALALESLHRIEATATRINKIIKAVKALSREGANDPLEETSALAVLTDALVICREKIDRISIKINVEIPETAKVNCRPVQLMQVLINLINNAADAIEHRQERWLRIGFHSDGIVDQIWIEDSGEGISKELRAKIMEPFFSTKSSNQGTGIGLSISKSIASSHGGRLFLDPSSEHTRFVFEIPAHKTVLSL